MSNLIAAAGARGVVVDGLAVDVRATLASAPPRFDTITLEVHGKTTEEGGLDKLVTIAEHACILTSGVPLTVRRA
jgi:hypothetical protein